MKDGGEAARAAKKDHIYMDHMGFGMGCCCLQVTFQVPLLFCGSVRMLFALDEDGSMFLLQGQFGGVL